MIVFLSSGILFVGNSSESGRPTDRWENNRGYARGMLYGFRLFSARQWIQCIRQQDRATSLDIYSGCQVC